MKKCKICGIAKPLNGYDQCQDCFHEMNQKQPNKSTHGGPRKGAGRKPLSYTTTTVRIPSPIVPKVKKMAAEFKAKSKK